MWRPIAFIDDRGTASRAKAASCARGFILKAPHLRFAIGPPEAASPTGHVSRVGRAVRLPSGGGMIVPGAARRKVNFDFYGAADALRRYGFPRDRAYVRRHDLLHARTLDSCASASPAIRRSSCKAPAARYSASAI